MKHLVTTIILVLTLGAVAQVAQGDLVLINEALVSHTGYDDTEYIELFGTPGYSLAGLSFIAVESENAYGAGTIRRRFDFGGADALGLNGFFLIGNSTGLMAHYGVTPDLSIPADMVVNVTGAFGNYPLTLALVATGSLSGPSVTGGEFALDAVALTNGGMANTFYFDAPVIGPDGPFFPAGARRIVDGVDTNMASDWVLADFNLGPANTPTAGTVVPLPGAALLGVLGLSVASWRLRRKTT